MQIKNHAKIGLTNCCLFSDSGFMAIRLSLYTKESLYFNLFLELVQ